ncbi:MAG: glycosyltransferase family 4 protein [Patescibacteria group bacterium]
MRKLKILIFSWRGLKHPLSGGAEIATFEHAKGWVKAGNKVTLFTSYFKNAKETEFIDGVEIIRKGGDVFGVKIKAFYWYLFNKHPKYDLVVDEFHGIPFFTPIYVRTKKLALIHEVAKEVWWFNPWPRPLNYIPGIIGTVFEPIMFNFLYKNIPFMTVSESTKTDLVNWGVPKENIKIVYNGVNPIKVDRNRQTRKTAIFLGALAKDKGIEDALKAFSLINIKEAGWQFWVVGWGTKNYLTELKTISNKLNISEDIKFWGYVNDKKKFELLSGAHVFINPSIREGWGLVNIEANSVGTPAIGYLVSGIKDSVVNEKTGLLSPLGDFKSLAENAIKLCKDSKSWERMSKNAISWSKKFTWGKSIRQSLILIKSLV